MVFTKATIMPPCLCEKVNKITVTCALNGVVFGTFRQVVCDVARPRSAEKRVARVPSWEHDLPPHRRVQRCGEETNEARCHRVDRVWVSCFNPWLG